MKRFGLWTTHRPMFVLVALCGTTPHRVNADDLTNRPGSAKGSSELLADHMVGFSLAAIRVLEDDGASNSYSHQTFVGPKNRQDAPHIQLESTDAYTAVASTDCSGWLSFALNTISPLHEAVLQSQRHLSDYNRSYSEDFALSESRRPWARAFVVALYFRDAHAETSGFTHVPDFEQLRAGDIGAYAMGRYTRPSDENRPKPKDTGHVFVVVGPPTVVEPTTEGYDGDGTLSENAAKVIAVPVVDSSSTVHFDPDSRRTENERYVLPEDVTHSRAKPGGVGTGTIWFALNDEGAVLQRRLGPRQKYRPVLARAARLHGRISLDEPVLDEEGALAIRVFDDAPLELDGLAFGEVPVDLSGKGGLRLVGGRLLLNGDSDFAGGVTVESGNLVVGSSRALGSGDVAIVGGTMTLKRPALAPSASLGLAADLPDGSVRLDFEGSNVVQSLRIGDTAHECGTWGGPESGATFVSPVFSGLGLLELAGGAPDACSQTLELTREGPGKGSLEGTSQGDEKPIPDAEQTSDAPATPSPLE